MNTHVKPPFIDTAQFTPYGDAGWTLMPGRRWNAVNSDGGKAGKLPRKDWRKLRFEFADTVKQCGREGANALVRMNPKKLVVEYDPRRDGDTWDDENSQWGKFCRRFNIDPADYPAVRSGGGGVHLYMHVPKGTLVRNSLKDEFPAIEFKGHKRYVLAAGSRHPNGKLYRWIDGHPPLEDAPMAPPELVDAIKRVKRTVAVGKGGQATPAHIEKCLAVLAVEDFREHEDWFALMCSVHHASGGAAREEFVQWSVADPEFASDEEEICYRWDSLDPDKADGYTVRTLNDHLANAGHSELTIEIGDADSDFEGEELSSTPADDWLEGGEPERSEIKKLATQFCTVLDGDLRVMHLEEHPEMPGRRYWKSTKPKAFEEHFMNRQVVDPHSPANKSRYIGLGTAFLRWAARPSTMGITFDPSVSPTADIRSSIIGKRLNLWTGWGCEPKPGKCDLIERMILEDLCAGDEKVAAYVLKWFAYKVQHPGEPCHTSLVFRGPKGVGKTTLGAEIMVPIFGSHGMVVSRRDQFVGQFSGHLASLCYLHADEAVWGGDKQDEGILKQIITDRHRLYRAMYKEANYGMNRIGLTMATNEEWAVPVSLDERRFMVQDVSNQHFTPPDASANHPNRKYWDAVFRQINSGGREAFFHMLLHMDLKGWTPRTDVPVTAARAKQAAQSLRGVERWYYEFLTAGEVPTSVDDPKTGEWGKFEAKFVPWSALLASCRAWMERNGQKAVIDQEAIAAKLEPLGWTRRKSNSVRGMRSPSHGEAMQIVNHKMGRE